MKNTKSDYGAGGGITEESEHTAAMFILLGVDNAWIFSQH